MTKMGGLKKYLPSTYWTFLIGALAIAGVPSSPASSRKDAILARRRRQRPLAALGGRPDHRRAHRVLHVPLRLPDLRRRVPRHPRAGAPPPRVAAVDDRPALDPRHRRDLRRLRRAFRRWSPADLNWFHDWLEPVIAAPPPASRAAEHEMSTGAEWALILITVASRCRHLLRPVALRRRQGAGQGADAGPSASPSCTACWSTSATWMRSTTR